MKPDSFEEQLKKQTFRTVPAEWRSRILESALQTEKPVTRDKSLPASGWEAFLSWLRPSPLAWSGLALMWAVIAVVHWMSLPTLNPVEREASNRSPHIPTPWRMSLWEQKQLQMELLDLSAPAEPRPEKIKPPKPKPTTSRTALQQVV